MTLFGSDPTPYIALLLVGVLPSEIWRWMALVVGRGLDETSEILVWVRAVATATLAAVVAKLAFFPAERWPTCRPVGASRPSSSASPPMRWGASPCCSASSRPRR